MFFIFYIFLHTYIVNIYVLYFLHKYIVNIYVYVYESNRNCKKTSHTCKIGGMEVASFINFQNYLDYFFLQICVYHIPQKNREKKDSIKKKGGKYVCSLFSTFFYIFLHTYRKHICSLFSTCIYRKRICLCICIF